VKPIEKLPIDYVCPIAKPLTAKELKAANARLDGMMLREVDHVSGGNGFAIVQRLPDGYVRLVSLGKNEIGNRAFLAWSGRLKPGRREENPLVRNSPMVDAYIRPHLLELVVQLRKDLESGVKIVDQTHIVRGLQLEVA